MAYDRPLTITYAFGSRDYGASDIPLSFQGPAGMKGKLRDAILYCSEAFAGTTTKGGIDFGTASDPDAYGSLRVPDAAGAITDTFVASLDDSDWLSATLLKGWLPEDTQIEMVIKGATGSPTGTADTWIVVDWFKN